MGCGCGKKFTAPVQTVRSAVSSSSPVPVQMQRGTFASPIPTRNVVRSQDVPYRGAKPGTFIRKSV